MSRWSDWIARRKQKKIEAEKTGLSGLWMRQSKLTSIAEAKQAGIEPERYGRFTTRKTIHREISRVEALEDIINNPGGSLAEKKVAERELEMITKEKKLFYGGGMSTETIGSELMWMKIVLVAIIIVAAIAAVSSIF